MHFNLWKSLWRSVCKEGYWMMPETLLEYRSFIKRSLIFDEIKLVVDVGAGSGLSSIPFCERGCHVVLLDLSVDALRLAREVYKRLGLYKYVDLVLGDAFHLPFRDKSMDLAFSWGLLEHFKSSEKILREKMRVARDIMAIVPYRMCPGYWLAKRLAIFLKREWPYGGEVERDYNERDLIKEFNDAGIYTLTLKKFGRTLGLGFLISIVTSNPLFHRKIAYKRPLLRRVVFLFLVALSKLTRSYDNLVAIKQGGAL